MMLCMEVQKSTAAAHKMMLGCCTASLISLCGNTTAPFMYSSSCVQHGKTAAAIGGLVYQAAEMQRFLQHMSDGMQVTAAYRETLTIRRQAMKGSVDSST